jgi:hypothetical protein
MHAPQGSTVVLAMLLPLIAWRVYLFPALALLVTLGASAHPTSLLAFVASLVAGAALGRYGIRTTNFEAVPGTLFYTPNAHLGIALSVLFVLRIAYRLLEVYVLEPGLGRSGAEFARSPLTLFVFGLLAGYYISYAIGLALWRARVLEVKDRKVRAEQDAADPL